MVRPVRSLTWARANLISRDDLALTAMDRRSLAGIAGSTPQRNRWPPAFQGTSAATAGTRALDLELPQPGISRARMLALIREQQRQQALPVETQSSDRQS